jgi:ribonuclease P protein component
MSDQASRKAPAKPQRLLKRADFLRTAKGARRHAGAFSLQTIARTNPSDGSDADVARFGFTVTKKVGGAVERNRMRRRLRAALAGLPADCPKPNHDYVIVAKREALSLAFDRLQGDLRRAIETIGRDTRIPTKRTDQAPHP